MFSERRPVAATSAPARGQGRHRAARLAPVSHRPLEVPQVAGADEHDRVAEPGLLHRPVEGGQAVLALVAHRLEGAARAERPRTLCRITWKPRSASGRTLPAVISAPRP
jgi:hypothetical protein